MSQHGGPPGRAVFSMQRGFQLGLLLLVVQLFQEGLGNIPAVTLAVLGFNVYLYMFPAAPLMKACVSLQHVYKYKEWRRLFLSPLHHIDDWHLYYNMASFIWKGIRLERRLGAAWFLYLLSVFSLLTGLVYLLLQALMIKLVEVSDPLGGFVDLLSHGSECAVGFSGILVGLLYTAGPLKTIMETCAEFVSSDVNNPQPGSYYSSSGTTGYRGTRRENSEEPRHAEDSTRDHTSDYTESYIAGLTEEEQLELAIRESLNERGQTRQRETASHRHGFQPSDEEVSPEELLRRRRLRRFEPGLSSQRRRRL
ncbi:rhomboid-related protein 4-like isoform X3 [Trachinotus anak]|uniref:rhomboid-related protein 4-like isoform X3 n=1 Tax=Trachinotus anak TaxID=443729 RepID=UPI0039F239B8